MLLGDELEPWPTLDSQRCAALLRQGSWTQPEDPEGLQLQLRLRSLPDELRWLLARALAEGVTPAAVANLVATSIEEDRYWVFPHPDWMGMVSQRWDQIGEGMNPERPAQIPGMPPMEQIVEELQAALGGEA